MKPASPPGSPVDVGSPLKRAFRLVPVTPDPLEPALTLSPVAAPPEGSPSSLAAKKKKKLPGRKKPCSDEERSVAILKLFEHYFSNQNLWRDQFMQKELEKNPDNYVTVAVLAAFSKVRALTTDMEVVKASLKQSTVLELNEDGTMVRRRDPLPPPNPTRDAKRVIYADNLPPGCTPAYVTQLFARFGKVESVVHCPRIGADGEIAADSPVSVFVEFGKKGMAKKAVQQITAFNKAQKQRRSAADLYPPDGEVVGGAGFLVSPLSLPRSSSPTGPPSFSSPPQLNANPPNPISPAAPLPSPAPRPASPNQPPPKPFAVSQQIAIPSALSSSSSSSSSSRTSTFRKSVAFSPSSPPFTPGSPFSPSSMPFSPSSYAESLDSPRKRTMSELSENDDPLDDEPVDLGKEFEGIYVMNKFVYLKRQQKKRSASCADGDSDVENGNPGSKGSRSRTQSEILGSSPPLGPRKSLNGGSRNGILLARDPLALTASPAANGHSHSNGHHPPPALAAAAASSPQPAVAAVVAAPAPASPAGAGVGGVGPSDNGAHAHANGRNGSHNNGNGNNKRGSLNTNKQAVQSPNVDKNLHPNPNPNGQAQPPSPAAPVAAAPSPSPTSSQGSAPNTPINVRKGSSVNVSGPNPHLGVSAALAAAAATPAGSPSNGHTKASPGHQSPADQRTPSQDSRGRSPMDGGRRRFGSEENAPKPNFAVRKLSDGSRGVEVAPGSSRKGSDGGRQRSDSSGRRPSASGSGSPHAADGPQRKDSGAGPKRSSLIITRRGSGFSVSSQRVALGPPDNTAKGFGGRGRGGKPAASFVVDAVPALPAAGRGAGGSRKSSSAGRGPGSGPRQTPPQHRSGGPARKKSSSATATGGGGGSKHNIKQEITSA